MSHVPSADPSLQERACERTQALLAQGARSLGIPAPDALVRFDLRGRSAGQVRLPSRGPIVIRYNAALLGAHPDDFIATTIPHEVAHALAFARHGTRIRPHGSEWAAIVRRLGATPTRCHSYDVADLKARTIRELDYHCACREHRLTTIRHRRAQAGRIYICRQCGSPLQPGRGPGVGPETAEGGSD